MKTFAFICLAIFLLSTTVAQSKIIKITDWEGSRTSRSTSANTEAQKCREECPGYSASVTYCNPQLNVQMEFCPIPGCKYFKRCVSIPASQH